MGNLGADPVIRSMSSGAKVASFSVATSEKWRDKSSNEQRERTEWHKVSLFGDGLVGVVERYLHKGSKVYVEGELRTRKWTDTNSGQEKYMTEIIVQGMRGQLIMLSAKGGGPGGDSGGGDEFYDGSPGQGQQGQGQGQQGSGSHGQQGQGQSQQHGGGKQPIPSDDFDDDIPF